MCRSLRMIPVECVARGYLTGSGLVEYERDRTVCGVGLPEGLVDGAEYKRRQYPPGTKISSKNFGRDRRLPITNRWREPLSEPPA